MEHNKQKELTRKELKTYRKKIRLQVIKDTSDYRAKLSSKLAIFNDAIKNKPRFVPHFLWNWCLSLFIDIDKIQELMFMPNPYE